MKDEKVEAMREFILLLTKQVKDAQIEASIKTMLDKLIAEKMAEIEAAVLAQGEPRIYGAAELAQMQQRGRDMHTRPAPVNQQSVRVGHLQISRHQTSGIWLRHDSGEAMQTDEDKLYQHLSEYWNKEF